MLFNLGMTYLYATKEFEAAAQYLRRSLEQSRPARQHRAEGIRDADDGRLAGGMGGAPWPRTRKADSYYPEDAELLSRRARSISSWGPFDRGAPALERLGPGGRPALPQRGRGPAHLSGQRLGTAVPEVRRCGALRQYCEIIRHHPEYLPAQHDLAELHQSGARRSAP